MRDIVFYATASGEIDSVAEYPDDTADATIDADLPDDCAWLEGDADPDKDYVLDGVVTERPDFGAQDRYVVDADGTETTLFTMPDPTIVTFRGTEYVAGAPFVSVDGEEDGDVLGAGDDYLTFSGGDVDFTFSSTRAGEFEFKLEPEFPYQPTVIFVEANAV